MGWHDEPCWRCKGIHPRHCDVCPQDPPCADHERSWPDEGAQGSYAKRVNAPLGPRTLAALRRRLRLGAAPRRKVTRRRGGA